MRSWLERARAIVPKRAFKRGSSDLPKLENLEEHNDYLRGLLVDDPTISGWDLREAMKKKGFLVSQRTMHTWVNRHNGKSTRPIIAAPIDELPCLDIAGVRQYERQLFKNMLRSTRHQLYRAEGKVRAGFFCDLHQEHYDALEAILF